MQGSMTRRRFLQVAGGTAALAGGIGLLPKLRQRRLLQPVDVALAEETPPHLYFAGTDGWISMPDGSPPIGFFFPDDIAPDSLDTYIFGFRNITGLNTTQITNQKMKAQHSAPLFWVDEYDGSNEFRLQLTNLGLQIRPDLTDAHTLHWHGFRNVIAFYDGEPTGSISVPVGRNFTYVFRPRDPGTYMYHCHVEDVEHVHMGMTGLVFVRPQQNVELDGKYAYNDGDGSTEYDREFALFLSEVWAEAHWCDSHIQLPDWSEYHADFSLLNGRAYPDTLAPNAEIDAGDNAQKSPNGNFYTVPYARDGDGDLVGVTDRPDLQYQPLSSLVTCHPNERVLLRFSNLGFKEAAMTLAGIQMRVIGRDATIMRGIGPSGTRADGADTSYETDTVLIGAGESFDVLFTAPQFSGGNGSSGEGYDAYPLYNRRLTQESNLDPSGFGGQRTEVRVYDPAITVAPQQFPNELGI